MYEFGMPDSRQLRMINSYRPAGSDPYTAEQLLTVPIVASNNLLSHSNGVWGEKSLKAMPTLFPGADFILDHTWNNSQNSLGFVYSAEKLVTREAPPWACRGLDPQQTKNSKSIVKQQGYVSIILMAAIEAKHPIAEMLLFRRGSDVSIGGLTTGEMICPLCDASFEDEICPHIPPYPGIERWLDEEEVKLLAPYYVNEVLYDGVELSITVDGNCAAARIMSESDRKWYEERADIISAA